MNGTASAIRSMTGFAHLRRQLPEGDFSLTLRSLNHRGLELRIYLSPELEPCEAGVRRLVTEQIRRGYVELRVHFRRSASTTAPVLNPAVLEAYLGAFEQARLRCGVTAVPDIDQLLRFPGMLVPPNFEGPEPALEQQLYELVRDAVAALNQFREREGAALVTQIRQYLGELREQIALMEAERSVILPKLEERLAARLGELLRTANLDAQRLVQEAALLADRTDIAEELARLRVHADELARMLERGGEVGKAASFLLQEMQREVQTILSKTSNTGQAGLNITAAALAARTLVEKMYEQVMNLE